MSTQGAVERVDGLSTSDVSGRNRMVGNVVASWAGHSVFIIAGFVMPRMIDRRLGQELLGIWDLAWSLISYFGFIEAGMGSSVNRYVARYRAANDAEGVNRAVSSVWCFHVVASAVVCGLTVAIAMVLPTVFGKKLGTATVTAQWVVLFLGGSSALQMTFAVFAGVLCGYHRWGLRNALRGVSQAITVGGMIAALCFGGGLVSLAVLYFVGALVDGMAHVVTAYRVCAGLHVRPSMATWIQLRDMMLFSGKTLIPSTGKLLFNQTVAVMIVGYLGPVWLAVYARSLSLIRHVETLIAKLSYVLEPIAGAIEVADKHTALGSLLIQSARYAMYVGVPITLLFVINGDLVLALWMGTHYQNSVVLAILAIGSLPTIMQMPLLSILTGINSHGRPGMAYLAAATLAVALAALALGPINAGLVGVAVAIVVPVALLNGIYLPMYACTRLAIPVGTYFRQVLTGPLLCGVLFGVCLIVPRLLRPDSPLVGTIVGCSVGSATLAAIYWRYVLPDRVTKCLRRRS